MLVLYGLSWHRTTARASCRFWEHPLFVCRALSIAHSLASCVSPACTLDTKTDGTVPFALSLQKYLLTRRILNKTKCSFLLFYSATFDLLYHNAESTPLKLFSASTKKVCISCGFFSRSIKRKAGGCWWHQSTTHFMNHTMTNRHSNTRSVRRSESPYVCRIANIDDSIGYRSNKEVCWECYLYICLSEVFDDNVILLSMHEYETFIHDGRHQSPVTRHKKEMTIASCIFLLFLFCFKLLRLWPHHARTKSFCLSFASRAPLITVFHWSIPTRLLCTPYSNAVLGLLYMYWGLGYLVPVLLQIPITRYDSLDNNPSVQLDRKSVV